MKTKEFIRQVKELGFDINRYGVVLVIRSREGEEVAYVSTKTEGSIETRFPCFVPMVKEEKDKLFCVLIEYSNTPIEERKEEKKYYIKHKYLGDEWNYLNFTTYNKKSGEWIFESEVGIYPYKTKFTSEELPVWVHELMEQGLLVKEEMKLND